MIIEEYKIFSAKKRASVQGYILSIALYFFFRDHWAPLPI